VDSAVIGERGHGAIGAKQVGETGSSGWGSGVSQRVRQAEAGFDDGGHGCGAQAERVRGLEERLESRILPLFKRRPEEVGELLPQLYLHGLAQGDFELALRGLLGNGAPL